ncbi:MAG: xanthine dehydrogenase family protein subunit M [Spartobacteria bacterium]|nr:xanthine dehydrogenase family protein subunit M [Spartobacteria bacterium]
MSATATQCFYPSTTSELTALLEQYPEARIMAGGTDLMVLFRSGVLPYPEHLIDISGIASMKEIETADDHLVIGACVTHAALHGSDDVRTWLPGLAQAAMQVGALQIQSMGTIGGNVANASPAGDSLPVLLVCDAEVVLCSAQGERSVPVTSFYLGYRRCDMKPGECIRALRIPKIKPNQSDVFRKLGTRQAQAISKVVSAARFTLNGNKIEHAAIAFGCMAPVPVRLPKTEALLQGRTLDEDTFATAELSINEELHPIGDIRSTKAYRQWVGGRLGRWLCQQICEFQ